MKMISDFLILIYQKCISPLKPACCKYYPTCSEYAKRAIKMHGLFKGIILASWRLLRCNPWSEGGIDDVPESFCIYSLKKGKEK